MDMEQSRPPPVSIDPAAPCLTLQSSVIRLPASCIIQSHCFANERLFLPEEHVNNWNTGLGIFDPILHEA
ncbi:hypothetical protein PBY51_013780 [Eleginops maclovinus]|uniref:Uncharacterized protein n=1 Tax=Eleginops maclovinus TaxID=56733 RepID=A0AAN7Y8B0_ELEMC|nr:hypothetical protein PBY51_013780 [Eleginops maclovinus]